MRYNEDHFMNVGTLHWLSAALSQTITNTEKAVAGFQTHQQAPCLPLLPLHPAQLLVLEGQRVHAYPGLLQLALQEVPIRPLLLPPRRQALKAILHRQVGLT